MDKGMNEVQRQVPFEIFSLVSLIGRPVEPEWKSSSRGYALRKPGSNYFGYVRFNQSGMFNVQAHQPFSDPKQLFKEINGGRRGWCYVDPIDTGAVGYAVSVLESAWDGRPYSKRSPAET